MFKWLYPFFISSILVACGGGNNPDFEAEEQVPEAQKVGAQKVEVIEGLETLEFSGGGLAGTGRVRFAELFSQPESAHNFTLSFQLEEGGSLTLFANALEDLSNGVEVILSRPSESEFLNVIAKAGDDVFDVSEFFAKINSSQTLSLAIDIHNDHGASAHILFWNESTGEELLNDLLNGRGFGVYWGMDIQEAQVFYVEKQKPRDEH